MEGQDDRHGIADGSQRTPEQKREIRRIRRMISQRRKKRERLIRELRASKSSGDRSENIKLIGREKSNKQELFVLQQRLHAAREGKGVGLEVDPHTGGALPDFAIIGAPKCGTTFLYYLLAKHPFVRPAAFKEVHYFDLLYDKGTQWYRRCFPAPGTQDEQKTTITGEATPGYLSHPQAPHRMAHIVPQARLIALLRNPIDRIYSGYHFFGSRRGRDTSEFERYAKSALEDPSRRVLSQGIYVEQLLRWSEYFPREQMLVLKSEEFFEDPRGTLGEVLGFLGLPGWEPEAEELGEKRNKGPYEEGMGEETRRRLEEYFEPYNRRLYEYLGEDFGW